MTKVRDSLKFILVTQFAMFVTIALDIPIARQVIGFVYISFMPGILILKILRLDLKSRTNTLLLSVGLSIAFIMFVGLVANELYPLIGVSEPLSILPLSVTIGTILLAMSLFSCKRDDLGYSFSLPSISQVLRSLLLIGVPLLAIFGALLTNSLILLLMVAAIVVLVIVTVFSRKLVPSELYAIVILAIAVSLLFHGEFISKYLLGWDVFGEFYVFRLTSANSLWDAAISTPVPQLLDYNAMLSVTILPTIYSRLLNMQGEWIFKIVFLLLFSLVPISLYQTYHQRFGKHTAFLSVFYFVLFPRFYGLSGRKQMVAELFFALLIFLMINRNIKPKKRQILSIIFGAALVSSHYSMSYIYLFYIFLTWFFMTLMGKHWFIKWNQRPRKTITGGFVLLFFLLTILWYTYVSIAPLKALLGFVTSTFNSFFVDFFNPEARGAVSEAISPEFTSLSSVQLIDFVINKFPYFFVFIGVIYLFKNYKQREFDWEYGLMVAASAFTVFLVIVVPYLAPAFVADRFYHVTLFYLAPVCILGGKVFFSWTLKSFARARMKPSKKTMHVPTLGLRPMCVFLVVIFLFKVGFVHEVVGDVPTSRSISFTRMKTNNNNVTKAIFYNRYVPEQDVFSAIWLSQMAGNNSRIYADFIAGKQVLRGYGMIIVQWKYSLSKNATIENDSYIYLRYLNIAGILVDKENKIEFTNFSHLINNTNKIYSNGDSEIHLSLPGGQ